MRFSDWSSDVCSSDLGGRAILLMHPTDRMKVKLLAPYENSKPADSALTNPALGKFVRNSDRPDLFQGKLTNYNVTINYEFDFAELISSTTQIGRASCRERVCQYV